MRSQKNAKAASINGTFDLNTDPRRHGEELDCIIISAGSIAHGSDTNKPGCAACAAICSGKLKAQDKR